MRIVHILHHSISPFQGQYPDGDPIHYDTGLPMKYGRAEKKWYPNVKIECWRPERSVKHLVTWETEDGLTHKVFPSVYGRYNLEWSPGLISAVRRATADPDTCFFVHGSYNLHAYLLASILKNTPAILQSHGGFPAAVLFRVTRHQSLRSLYLPLILIERRTLTKFPLMYTISKEEQGYVEQHLPRARAAFSPTGLDFDHFCPGDKATARTRCGIATGEQTVLYVGRLAPEKGLVELIEAFATLSCRTSEVHLRLVGSGPLRREIEERIRAMNLCGRVTLVGHVPPAALPNWFRAADVSVMPSYLEWFGVVAAESLACGTPVVTTRAGGAVDIVDQFECGELVPPRDAAALAHAIARVLDGCTKRVPNIARGREVFDWNTKVGHVMSFFAARMRQQ